MLLTRWKRPIWILLVVELWLVGQKGAVSDPEEVIDPTRPHIAKLKADEKTQFSDFIYPYLIVQTAVIRPQKTAEVAEQLKGYLRKTALPARGHFSSRGIPADKLDLANLPLPKPAITGNQLSGLEKCDNEFCVMKLQTQSEKPLVTASKTKLDTFHQIVVDRVKAFLLKNELRGYENRVSNQSSVMKMIGVLTFLNSDYPKCGNYFSNYFWSQGKSPCVPYDSFLREEMVVMEGTILQPILRVSEVFLFQEPVKDPSKYLFVEMHIYSNHYFDTSLRTYEVFPSQIDPKKTVLAVTDIMEIDELAKSGLIRFLYQGKMIGAVQDAQGAAIRSVK